MNRSWLQSIALMLLVGSAVAPMAADEPASATAVEPGHCVFDTSDGAETAFTKLRETRPQNPRSAADYQLACRDFCTRFADSPHYAEVRLLAVRYWVFFAHVKAAQVSGWDPTDAEHDPRLDAEQRADVAMLVANAQANLAIRKGQVSSPEPYFDAIVPAVRAHRETQRARATLIRAALEAPPAKAIPVLRELYPEDDEVAQCIELLGSIGKPCAFSFTAMDGRLVDSRDLLGKVIVLDFWAKSCGPCIQLIPELKKMNERLGPRGLVMIGINLDKDRAAAEAIIAQFDLPWPEAFDGRGWHSPLARRFMVSSMPHYVAIDRRGLLRFMGSRASSIRDTIRIEALLAEEPPQS